MSPSSLVHFSMQDHVLALPLTPLNVPDMMLDDLMHHTHPMTHHAGHPSHHHATTCSLSFSLSLTLSPTSLLTYYHCWTRPLDKESKWWTKTIHAKYLVTSPWTPPSPRVHTAFHRVTLRHQLSLGPAPLPDTTVGPRAPQDDAMTRRP